MKKYLLIFLILSITLVSCGGCTIKYTVYIPSQNRFAEFHNKGESALNGFQYKAGDTVLYNGVKAVIVCH